MLDAIRNLGILKMIDEFDEFDLSALESVDSFLEERGRAIESRAYARLQFEPISADHIGILGQLEIPISKNRISGDVYNANVERESK
jgi:hypothetical protein